MKNIFSILLITSFVFIGCQKNSQPVVDVQKNNIQNSADTQIAPIDNMNIGQTAEQNSFQEYCDKVNASDIIIKVNFAEGVVKDTSYETGFYYSPIISHMKLARNGCDYKVGFSYEEMKGKGVVEVGVRGYNDNNRRTIAGQPISVVFDKNGVPDIDPYIEVTITN
jgi:hypothetical protein